MPPSSSSSVRGTKPHDVDVAFPGHAFPGHHAGDGGRRHGNFKVPVLLGMWFRFPGVILDQQDDKSLGDQFRIILNWDRDLI